MLAWELYRHRTFMDRQRGFSIAELLVVVAVVMIIAAIAIPNLMRSRIAANEASAVSALRTITVAQISYNYTYDRYATSLSALSIPSGGTPPSATAAGLLDAQLASGSKSGYSFVMSASASSFAVTATPQVKGFTGIRSFCSDQSNVISFSDSGDAATCQSAGTPF